MPAVSVIIPIYNVELFIARCVRSLFGQTLVDMEYIFVDDCSPDRSIAIMRGLLDTEFPTRRSQVKVYQMPHNSGQAKVRMQGISMATGEYIIHCDSDDEVDKDTYRLLYEKALEGDYDAVSCNFFQEGCGKKRIWRCEVKSVEDLISGKAHWSLCSRLIRRSLLQTDILPPVANNGEDMCLTLQVSLKAQRTAHVDLPLYHYCFNENSITKTPGYPAAIMRWKAFKSNAEIILTLLVNRYGYSPSHPSVVQLKYRCRYSLLPYVNTKEGYNLWKNTYPEIDRVYLFISGIPWKDKFWFVMIHLRLYSVAKSITRRISRNS